LKSNREAEVALAAGWPGRRNSRMDLICAGDEKAFQFWIDSPIAPARAARKKG